eukprot:433831-Amorphochlora_amoeboformis.AAC.1
MPWMHILQSQGAGATHRKLDAHQEAYRGLQGQHSTIVTECSLYKFQETSSKARKTEEEGKGKAEEDRGGRG